MTEINTLDIEKQNWLVSKLHDFYQIFNENRYIPEEAYERVFVDNPEVDNACTIKYCPTCHENLGRHEEVCGKSKEDKVHSLHWCSS
jgi:hypothetical protein